MTEASMGQVDTMLDQSLIFKSKAAQMAVDVGFLPRKLSFVAVQFKLDCLCSWIDFQTLGAIQAEANEMRALAASMIIERNIQSELSSVLCQSS